MLRAVRRYSGLSVMLTLIGPGAVAAPGHEAYIAAAPSALTCPAISGPSLSTGATVSAVYGYKVKAPGAARRDLRNDSLLEGPDCQAERGVLGHYAQVLFSRALAYGAIECLVDASRRPPVCDPDGVGLDRRLLPAHAAQKVMFNLHFDIGDGRRPLAVRAVLPINGLPSGNVNPPAWSGPFGAPVSTSTPMRAGLDGNSFVLGSPGLIGTFPPSLTNSVVPPVVAVASGPLHVVNVAIVPANILGPLGSATPIAFHTILSSSIVGGQLRSVLSGPNTYGGATFVIAGLAPGAALPIGPLALSGATYAESANYARNAGSLAGHGIYTSTFGGNPYANLGSAGVIFGLRR